MLQSESFVTKLDTIVCLGLFICNFDKVLCYSLAKKNDDLNTILSDFEECKSRGANF